MNVLSPKDPAEIIAVTFDFTNVAATFASAAWTISVIDGADANPAAMLYGAPSNSGACSTHLIQGGIAGNIYLLRADITLSSGEKYALAGRMAVQTLN